MPIVRFTFAARLHGKKNSHEIHYITRGGKRVPTIGISKQAKFDSNALAWVALVAANEQGWEMPPPKTPIGIRYEMHCNSVRSGDIDNGFTTALDALQKVLFDNDMYVMAVQGKKIIHSGEEYTTFEVYTLDSE